MMEAAEDLGEIEVAAADAAPQVHAAAQVRGSVIGRYTDIGPNWTVLASRLGDYSYLAGSDGVVIYTEIGKFCSIASHAFINPAIIPCTG